ncbi:MAG: patatin-like phospholipase family protein [Flavobacteriaceae bacterium]
MKKHKLGLVLSGGGVKGAAHIGVLQALEEYDIKPTCIAGTSAGALAGAFYACGYSANEIFRLINEQNFFKLNALTWEHPGMMNIEKLFNAFVPYFEGRTFESLGVELQIATTDIIQGTLKVFDSGPLLKPLFASCAFPFVFAPVEIDGTLYSDGGIINNFPTKDLINKADKTLGVYVSPLRKITKKQLNSALDVADRAYRITNRYESLNKLKDCTWVINPLELQDYGTFTLSKIKEIYHIGYKYGLEIAPKIKEGVGL